MNKKLYEYWIRKALVAANRSERREISRLIPQEVRAKLLEQMCRVARDGLDYDTECKLRYFTPDDKWQQFNPGIFDMRDFKEIIERNLRGVMNDKTPKNPNYIRTMAIALMKEYYEAYLTHCV